MTLPPTSPGQPEGGSGHTEELIDRRVLELIQSYAQEAGAQIDDISEFLIQLQIPANDIRFFDRRSQHLLALSVNELERRPEAELPVMGSAFWNRMLTAVRNRGHRRIGGTIPVTVATIAEMPDFKTADATVAVIESSREKHRLMRLTTRLTIAAGTAVEEHLHDSEVIDLTTGGEVGGWVAGAWGLAVQELTDAPAASSKAADHLVTGIIASIEERVSARLQSLEQESRHALDAELARIDRYYNARIEELREQEGPGSSGEAAVEREHRRCRADEERRHQLKVDVEPLQVEERTILVEHARWRLTSTSGRSGELSAHRYLTGPGTWSILCPCCQIRPELLTVCRSGHAVGVECTHKCGVCAESFCTEHGHASCAIDGAPMCSEHSEQCYSCKKMYCTSHQATCTETGHRACSGCVQPCAICVRNVCARHGLSTGAAAPRGARVVCSTCVRYCEGSTAEPIGVDESAACGTCGKQICERHQVACAVDGKPHCSKHLRRADRSRRFICESHRAECGRESGVLFATDEVHACCECGIVSCQRHGAVCHEDQSWHCIEHLSAITDLPNAFACARHRTQCHVDGRAFSLRGTATCEVCGRLACRTHRRACPSCGGQVCSKDEAGSADKCITCSKLAPTTDIPDEILAAAARLVEHGAVKRWALARDGGRYVVELNLGWTRRIVFTVPHGAAEPIRATRRSVFGSSSLL